MSTFTKNCANDSYTTYVINDGGATYADAYFELNYVNIFSTAEPEMSFLQGPAASSGAGLSLNPVGTGDKAVSSSVTSVKQPQTTGTITTSDGTDNTSGSASLSSGARDGNKAVSWMASAVISLALGLVYIHGAHL
jgi:hypothetical protein